MNDAFIRLVYLTTSAIVVASSSRASDCIPPSTTLKDAHASADFAVIAKVTGCADAQLSEYGDCPNELYRFDVVEVLKESNSARGYDIVLKGSAVSGCGLSFRAGHEYLLFIDEHGNRIPGASGYLTGDGSRSKSANERLRILRQYRDKEINDLSEPWRFSEHSEVCSIHHQFDGGELSFTYGYEEGSYFRSHRLEKTYGPNGEIWLDTASNVTLEDSFHGEMIGPDYGLNALIFSVSLENSVHPGSMTIKVGNKVWSLRNRTIRLQIGDSDHVLISDNVVGRETAHEIFEEMIEPAVIVISAEPSGIGPKVIEESELVFETRSTQLPDAAQNFKSCVAVIVQRHNGKYP